MSSTRAFLDEEDMVYYAVCVVSAGLNVLEDVLGRYQAREERYSRESSEETARVEMPLKRP